jgi:hypothetical protein
LALFVFVLGVADATAQNKDYSREFCGNNWNWSDGKRVSTSDLREVTTAGGSIVVDGKRNGGISVRGENRSDVLVRACVQAWAATDEAAKSLARSVRVETNGSIRAEGADEDKNWSVSFQILVPRSTNLDLKTMNGGISISDVEGQIVFDAKNGGINLQNLAGDVKGSTVNGGIKIELSGNSWKGAGLDVKTTNGGVSIDMPAGYAARFETKTVNGGFKSEIPGLQNEKSENDGYRRPGADISRDLNGGGPLVRAITTNGGVKVSSN